jgi:glycine betaine/proline transport system substrate-binding protein
MHFIFCRGRGVSFGACDPTLQATEGAAAEADHSSGRCHHPEGTDDPPHGTGRLGPLPRLLKTPVLLLAVAALGVGCGFGGGGSLTLGHLNWNENVASATLTKVLLEDDLGYDSVELKLARGVGNVYDDLIGGETNAFQDAWMPNHQQYVDEGKGQLEVLKAPWYVGKTKYGIAVPDYMKGVDSISDLDHSGTDMITGIEPGTVLMQRIASDVIPRYHLSTNLVQGSTPAMLAELKQCYGMKEPIVFLAWKPHWMNRAYHFHYLSDPKNAMGPFNEPQTIHTVARKGLADDQPAAYALMNHMRLDAGQVAGLEISINDAPDPQTGVRRWLKEGKNRELVRPWVEAAKRAQEE